MLQVKTILLNRTDLIEGSKTKDIVYINKTDFTSFLNRDLANNDIIIFVDNNGESKIIKNIYGDKGYGRVIRTLETMKEHSVDNKIGYAEEYINYIIDLYND
jgi:predicted DNA binding protein